MRMLCEHSQKDPRAVYLIWGLALARAPNPRNGAVTNKAKLPSHLLCKLEQRVLICFFTLKEPRPQQIQIELSDVYHKQAIQLPGVNQ
jgi:hypothetical protein